MTLDHVEKIVIGLLAGYAADIRFGTPEEIARLGASEDFDKAEEQLERAGLPPDLEPWLAKTKTFVEREWKIIQALAEELLKSKTLDNDEIETIIELHESPRELSVALMQIRMLKRVAT